MFALFVINYLDRVNVGIAAVRMNADLGFSAAAFGLGAGLLFAGYVLFELPSNLVLRRVGARRWMAVLAASWGLCATGTAFVHGETEFYLLRFLLGVCEAGFLPGAMLYLTEWFPSARRGRLTAALLLAIPATVALGTPLSALLMTVDAGMPGWRFMFLVEGLPAILLAPLVLRMLPDRPEDATWLTEEQRSALRTSLEQEHPTAIRSLRQALGDHRVYAVAGLGFCVGVGLYAMTYFLPQIVAELRTGSGITQIGLLTGLPSACAALVMWSYARHSDRSGERLLHIAVPLFIAAAALSLAPYLSSAAGAMVAITITTIGASVALPVMWQLPGLFMTGDAAAGGIGLIAALANSSGFFAPYLIGILRDLTGDYHAGMLIQAAFLLAGALIALLLRRVPALRTPSPPASIH
ncbi:MFS transporter [Pseudonocardiaceae bacterium YIM PH 21723]|nr:MFS transporter [Pseudonocardiaceae bacterium YIM PH 21723]